MYWRIKNKYNKNKRKIYRLLMVIFFYRSGGGGWGILMFVEMEVGVGGIKVFFGFFLFVNLRKFIFLCF